MMSIPSNVNARWIATLGNDQLIVAEAQLYTAFKTREVVERSRAGARYVLLQGPAALVNAWHQWALLNNEARVRGVNVSRPLHGVGKA